MATVVCQSVLAAVAIDARWAYSREVKRLTRPRRSRHRLRLSVGRSSRRRKPVRGIGVLAERAQMTNQSMGCLVDALERRGYVERRPDPVDRRAALVVVTDRGRAQIDAARRHIADIEREWEQRIGPQRMAALREALEELALSLHGDTDR